LAQAANGSKSIFVPSGLEEGETDSEDEGAGSERGSGASADLGADAQAAVALGRKQEPGSGRLSLFQAKVAASDRLGAAQPATASGEDFVIGTQAPIPAHQQQEAVEYTASPPFDAEHSSSATLLPDLAGGNNRQSFFQASLRRRTTSTPEDV
jgi:hypothetical protein